MLRKELGALHPLSLYTPVLYVHYVDVCIVHLETPYEISTKGASRYRANCPFTDLKHKTRCWAGRSKTRAASSMAAASNPRRHSLRKTAICPWLATWDPGAFNYRLCFLRLAPAPPGKVQRYKRSQVISIGEERERTRTSVTIERERALAHLALHFSLCFLLSCPLSLPLPLFSCSFVWPFPVSPPLSCPSKQEGEKEDEEKKAADSAASSSTLSLSRSLRD